MSGLINSLLGIHFKGVPDKNTPSPINSDVSDLVRDIDVPSKNNSEATPTPVYDPIVAERQLSGELACCANETRPCKHWVWDTATGEGYRNILSGRVLEVE